MGVVVTNAAIGEANRGRAAGANASSCGTTHISVRREPQARAESEDKVSPWALTQWTASRELYRDPPGAFARPVRLLDQPFILE